MKTVKYEANTLTLRMLENQSQEDRNKTIQVGYRDLSEDVTNEEIERIENKYKVKLDLYII